MANLVSPGYTLGMKTAISMPDDLFERMERRVAHERTSRSAFIARAVERYLDRVEPLDVAARLDAYVATMTDDEKRDQDEWVGAAPPDADSVDSDDEWDAVRRSWLAARRQDDRS